MIPPCKDEGEFNALMRAIFRAQGLGAIHIREADSPGPSDLLVWSGSEILGWAELKIDGKSMEVSQVEFSRNQDALSGNVYVFDYNRKGGRVRILRPEQPLGWNKDLNTFQMLDTFDDVIHVAWKNFFWRHKRTDMRYR